MYKINDDLSIYVTRGDIVFLNVTADNNGKPYTFQVGDLVRIKVFAKKNCENVVLQKDFPVTAVTQTVEIFLDENDTKIGKVISKPTDYWYEVELNPLDDPQTIIGYDEDGAKIFKLFPEGADLESYIPTEEDIPFVDDAFDFSSERPVQNQVIARAFANLRAGYQATHEAVAKLHVTPQMFGAVGDGVADDTEAIKRAVSAIGEGFSVLHIPSGTYLVSEDISLVSNMTLEGEGNNSIIKRIGNDFESYGVISCRGIENVVIKNIHIQGERSEHTGTTGEWGHCVDIRGCKNITVKDCKLTDAWGDGIYLGTHDSKPCVNTVINNCDIDNNRRQGISVINSDRLIVRGCIITNTKGTAPEGGIDFESNYDTDICTNSIIENCIFDGNSGGSIIIGNHIVPYEIAVRDCTSTDRVGVIMYGDSVDGVSGGYFVVGDCNFRNTTRCFMIYGKSSAGLPVKIKNCDLYASANNGVCIECSSESVECLGGLYIKNCNLNNENSSYDPIRIINSKENGTYDNIIIDVYIEPSDKYRVYINAPVAGKASVKVGKKRSFNASFELAQYYVFDGVDIKCDSASRRITCKENFPYNCPVTVRKISGTYALQIYLENGAFPQFGSVNSIELKNNYDEITLIHEATGVWSVKDSTTNGIAHE